MEHHQESALKYQKATNQVEIYTIAGTRRRAKNPDGSINHDLDSSIVIRSAYIEDEVAEIQAGAGLVLDSIPIAEADETRTKAQAVISAIKYN